MKRKNDFDIDAPVLKKRKEFSDPLLAFTDDLTEDEARLTIARKIIDSVATGEDGHSDLEDGEDGDLTHSILKKKALQATNKWAYKWADALETFLDDTEQKGYVLKGHRHAVTCVCLSRDDSRLYSAAKDGAIIVWDVEKRKKVKIIKRDSSAQNGHAGPIFAMAVNSENSLLATGGKGGYIYVWETRGFTLKHRLYKHSKDVTALSFRDGTNSLYSGGLDRSLIVWDASSGSWQETLVGPTEPVTCLHGLEKPFFVCSGMDKAVRFFKVESGTHLVFPRAHKGTVDSICMLNHERWVSGGNDGVIRLWGANKKKPLAHLSKAHDGKWITSLASRTFGDVFASGSNDGWVNLYRVRNDAIEEIGSFPVNGFVNCLSMSQKGAYLVCGVGQEHRLGRWEVQRTAKNHIMVFPLNPEVSSGAAKSALTES